MINVKLHFILYTVQLTVEHKHMLCTKSYTFIYNFNANLYFQNLLRNSIHTSVFYLITCKPHKSSLYIFTELGILFEHIYVMRWCKSYRYMHCIFVHMNKEETWWFTTEVFLCKSNFVTKKHIVIIKHILNVSVLMQKIQYSKSRLLKTRIIDTISLLKQNVSGRVGRI